MNPYRSELRAQEYSAADLGLPDVAHDAPPLAPPAPGQNDFPADFEVKVRTACAKLVGVLDQLDASIVGALRAGKKHLMLYGPPGTGKTELAKDLAAILSDAPPRVITASADWSSSDLVGGYRPAGSGQIAFMPGVLLDNCDQPVVIDELNRCDIDKAIGPLFTLLTQGETILPFVVKPGVDDRRISVGFSVVPSADPHRFTLQPSWRILATLNTTDKASLYQMSFALMRRFAWIHVPVPDDKQAVVDVNRAQHGLPENNPRESSLVSQVWDAICDYRLIGAAPFLDVLNFMFDANPHLDPLRFDDHTVESFCRGLQLFIVPLLDGMSSTSIDGLCGKVAEILEVERDAASIADLRSLLYELNGI